MSVGRVRVGCMYPCVLVSAYCVCVCVCGFMSPLVRVECMESVYIVCMCVL